MSCAQSVFLSIHHLMAQQPTVDDLRVKLCYICREEERDDSPLFQPFTLNSHSNLFPLGRPDPPPVWTHPCKCTLIAHESCLLHWIKTQQRDFGRTRGDLRCPQCGDRYEFEGYNPLALRILNRVHSFLSHSGRIILVFSLGTVVVSFGAGEFCTVGILNRVLPIKRTKRQAST
jgi:E3 ubiquitin-protein ligase DOA10